MKNVEKSIKTGIKKHHHRKFNAMIESAITKLEGFNSQLKKFRNEQKKIFSVSHLKSIHFDSI